MTEQTAQDLTVALVNNTESVLFIGGVLVGSLVFGLFLYSLFKTIG